MFEQFGFEETTAKQASVILALMLGLAFGFLAERTKFCFRRAIVGEDRKQAAGIWLMALAAALFGTQFAVAQGLITFDGHRFMAAELPWLAIVLGGGLFGAGMVLTRGCVSRLSVLSASGNLRALTVLLAFAVVAHATMKGVLAPLRSMLAQTTVSLGEVTSLAALPGGALVWSAIIAVAALGFALRSGNRALPLTLAVLIGLLVPAGWVGTGFVLYDDFDPIALESLAFTAPVADGLFYALASTAIEPGFGTGLIGGVLGGALLASLLFGSFQWQSFSSPRETGRYLAGAALMGVGGVLAGGCTVGAGLAGVPTLSVAATLALAAIAGGALVMNALLNGRPQAVSSSGADQTTPAILPAE